MGGVIPPLGGNFKFATNTVVGYYEQENLFENPNITPLQYILEEYPKLTEQQARSNLARCGLKSEHIMEQLRLLSGGEQAKVKICKLVLHPCNILFLDEPTNHMDANAIAQLSKAIKNFDGTILFVSHDKDFVEKNADKVLRLEDLLK